MYTAKVNIRAQEERERKEKERRDRETISKLQALTGPPVTRKRKGLNWCQAGSFVHQAEQLRKKARLDALKKKISERSAKTGIADAVKLATLTTKEVDDKKVASNLKEVEEEVPDVEWWDESLLGNRTYDDIVCKGLKPEDALTGITNLVEHPPIKKPAGPDPAAIQVPIMLTKKERKKLKRQNRKNAELEKQEKIKLGLLPKPEPKLKRSNIMYALGDEAIINPSMADQMVREQEEKRKQAHIEHNESKKLNPTEKRQKNLRKVQEDLSITGIWVSVYRILDMRSQAHKFKVSKNAKQLTMSGCLILYKDINLVIVEGGPRQNRKFKHLMIDRIRWDEDHSTATDESTTGPTKPNRCLLVWEGQVSQRSFRGFKIKPMTSETEAKNYLKEVRVDHYWDLAYKMSILESIDS